MYLYILTWELTHFRSLSQVDIGGTAAIVIFCLCRRDRITHSSTQNTTVLKFELLTYLITFSVYYQ